MTFSPRPDAVYDGYRLIRFLGKGGFGEVWLCRSEAMGDYRALKWIPESSDDRLEKEYASLLYYRNAAASLRSPHLVAIEHVNRVEGGLFYVMPLADGSVGVDPATDNWFPSTVASRIQQQTERGIWFTSGEIISLIQPILAGLQTLSEAGLIHRDVKPDNILFYNNQPCLGDISLLGEDRTIITRRGTPGYLAPSWYTGGHPDMYGAAALLYTLLTGNCPDKMGKAKFLWPPQGEASLSASEKLEWKRLHAIVRRATEEEVGERYRDFSAMSGALKNEISSPEFGPSKSPVRWISAGLATLGVAAATVVTAYRSKLTDETKQPHAKSETKDPYNMSEQEKADYTVLASLTVQYLKEAEYEKALHCVDQLLASHPAAAKQPSNSLFRVMALKGLGRIDEAKEELRKEVNVSTNITAMTSRKELWEDFSDLDSAEKDLSRILDKYGPNTFVLFLRADVRAQRQNFNGVQSDRETAYKIKSGGDEQKQLVDTMWQPLETKYSGYEQYLQAAKQ